ncbi:ectoine/hydroxyectoine ABC transporter substrate-binding protein EhuB [Bradyrhizobium sp. BEA-2-5]|uniref:ectoine/hydroxyectoine ABC transporter substrate-binding protein EhuB n=1 Tax=Bradyrhizobium sp. BEA-2-5 TaxID=3080015 RepID=UPI00293ECD3A|nr:ectoine/hydroxyectoine ABC transporter substrate-binding protein EhuB [Bradyrhizobium sp. BEA-2-5]WOH80320.1 ectoine/hydroxyectoine ABC transporter substrate-binding protein EhuB [Bradyrhizobium sp. BEA-2-5]
MKRFSGSRTVSCWSVALVVSLVASSAEAQTLKDKIAGQGKITIGVYNAWPAGFVRDEKVQGFGPEILKDAAKPLGVKNIDFQVMEFGALIPSLMAKRIDVVAGGMYVTPGRCKQVAFSDPIGGPQGNAILVKAGNPLKIHGYEDMAKNANVRVGNLRGAASLEYMAAAGVPKERIQLYQDHQTALAALLADRVDVIINGTGAIIGSLRDPSVKGLERADPFREIVNGAEMIHYNAFAFRPEDAEFRDLFNKSLNQVGAEGKVKNSIVEYGFSEREATPDGVTSKELCGADYR